VTLQPADGRDHAIGQRRQRAIGNYSDYSHRGVLKSGSKMRDCRSNRIEESQACFFLAWKTSSRFGILTAVDPGRSGFLVPFGVPTTIPAICLPLRSSGGLGRGRIQLAESELGFFGLEADGD
jgi:hypothetical protein